MFGGETVFSRANGAAFCCELVCRYGQEGRRSRAQGQMCVDGVWAKAQASAGVCAALLWW